MTPRPQSGSSVVATIRDHSARLGDAVALRFLPQGAINEATVSLTFADLDRRACAVAAALAAERGRGQRALLLFAPGLDFIVAYLGCLYAGVIAVPAYPPDLGQLARTLPRVRAIARDCGAAFVLTTGDITALAAGLGDVAPELAAARWLATDGLAGDGSDAAVIDTAEGDVAFLQYTSGSTAEPRGVMVTHGNLRHNLLAIRHLGDLSASSVGVNWLPSYHDMGLIGAILQPLFTGFPAVLLAPQAFLRHPVRWLQAISHHRGTASAFPNFALDLCTRKISDDDIDRLDLCSWTRAWNGAEPVRAASLERFAARFARCGFRRAAFVPVYGLAEATLIVTGEYTGGALDVRAVSRGELGRAGVRAVPEGDADAVTLVGCGRAIADTEVVIVDANSRRVAPSAVGEIWVRGPSVARGYYGEGEEKAAANRETFGARLADEDGDGGPFLRTGDLGFVDGETGRLFVTGRQKDVIILRGANLYPQDLEQAVEGAHAAVRPGAVAAFALGSAEHRGAPDNDGAGGEALGLVVELREALGEAALDAVAEALRDAVFQTFGLTPAVLSLVAPGGVPKTSSGKIQRYACRAGLGDGTLPELRRVVAAPAVVRPVPSPPAPSRENATRERVVGILAQVTGWPREALLPETRLIALGLDSLAANELLAELERSFGAVGEGLLRDATMTVADLLGALESRAPQQDPLPAAGASRREESISDFPELQEIGASLSGFHALGVENPYGRDLNAWEREARDGGHDLINFATYDYLGLARDPRVAAAASAAIARYGTSASASRLAWGEREVHRALEADLAAFLGCDAALVFASGHATNVTAIATLVGPEDIIVHDRLAHDSLLMGARLSGARRVAFPHNDLDALERTLRGARGSARRALIIVEGAYSMDGDLCPLRELVELKRRHGALLFVDEAHSLGVVGRSGRGVGEHAGVARGDVDVWMGTLSKALASCGGYVAGSRALVDLIRYRGGGFVYAAAIPPAAAAAAQEALRLLQAEPERVTTLQRRAARFLSLCRARGVDTGMSAGTAIVPAILGDSARCLRVSERLRRRGVNAPPVFFPAVEDKLARLRFFVSARHSEAQLTAAADALAAAIGGVDRDGVDAARGAA